MQMFDVSYIWKIIYVRYWIVRALDWAVIRWFIGRNKGNSCTVCIMWICNSIQQVLYNKGGFARSAGVTHICCSEKNLCSSDISMASFYFLFCKFLEICSSSFLLVDNSSFLLVDNVSVCSVSLLDQKVVCNELQFVLIFHFW